MARSGRDKKEVKEAKNEVKPANNFETSRLVGNNTAAIRTVLFIEAGDMDNQRVAAAIKAISKQWDGNEHPHYVCCVRNGKITNDIFFETEFLDVVNKVCEVKDGKISLKGEAHEVEIFHKIL